MVKQGVISGLISNHRYESYLRIIGDLQSDDSYERILKEICNARGVEATKAILRK